MQGSKKSITRKAVTTLAGAAMATTGIGAAAIQSAPAAHAAGCNNRLYMVDGYHRGTTGKSFENEPTVPGWDNVLFSYENGIFPVVDPHTLDETVSKAVPSLEHEAIAYHQQCPNAKIAFHGYSFGALVAGNVVESLAHKSVIPHNQMNAVLYGDPRRPIAARGIEGPAGGILTMLPNLPGITAPGPRDFKDVDVSEVCHENDVICNMANPFTNALAVANEVQGYRLGDHGYAMNPYGEHSHPGDHWYKQAPRLNYGAPLPIPMPTPNEMLNNNAAWNAGVEAVGSVANEAGLIELFNNYGLPGELLVGLLRDVLAQNGIDY